MVSQIIKDPILRKEDDWYEKTREQQLERNIQRVRRLYEIDKQRWFLDHDNDYYSWTWNIFKGAVRMMQELKLNIEPCRSFVFYVFASY